MNEKRRYHFLALLLQCITFFSQIWWFFILAWLQLESTLMIVVMVSLIVLPFSIAVIKYLKEGYQLTDSCLIVYSGFFTKKEVVIPYERIQTIKQRQWFFFKPFRVVRLAIETAGGHVGEAEAVLPVVLETVLNQIENHRQSKLPPEKDYQRVYQVTNGQIFLYSLTNTRILFALFVVGVAVWEQIPTEHLEKIWGWVNQFYQESWQLLLVVIGLILATFLLITMMKNFSRFYRFQVMRVKDTLTIGSGLFQRRMQKVPLRRIQGIKMSQSLMQKLFGLTSVEVLLAGSQEENSEQVYLLPIISKKQVVSVLAFLLPEWEIKERTFCFVSRNHYFYLLRVPVLILLPFWLGSFFFTPWLPVVTSLLLLLALLAMWLKGYLQGYNLQDEKRICLQTTRFLTEMQLIIEKSKVQAYAEQTSKWLFPKQIKHFKVYYQSDTSSASVSLKFISQTSIQQLKHFLKPEKLIP